MDPIEVNQAASKVLKVLYESGKVAKTFANSRVSGDVKVTLAYNEELGGLAMAQVEGTFGLRKDDLSVQFRVLDAGRWLIIPNADSKTEPQQVTDPVWYGNRGLVGMGDDTGWPWVICVDFDKNVSLIITSLSEGEYVFSADIDFETIHPIDPKYLPGVCLPVVELEDYPDPVEGAKTLSDKEAEQVKKALATSGYCLVFMLNTYETFIAKRHDEALAFIGFPLMSNASGGIGKLMLIGTEDGTTYIFSWIDN